MGFAVLFSIATHALLVALFMLVMLNCRVARGTLARRRHTVTADRTTPCREIFDSITVDPTGRNTGGEITTTVNASEPPFRPRRPA